MKEQFVTSESIRFELWRMLADLRDGRVTPQAAMSGAKLAQTMINAARADVEAARFVSESQGNEGGTVTPLKLAKL